MYCILICSMPFKCPKLSKSFIWEKIKKITHKNKTIFDAIFNFYSLFSFSFIIYIILNSKYFFFLNAIWNKKKMRARKKYRYR